MPALASLSRPKPTLLLIAALALCALVLVPASKASADVLQVGGFVGPPFEGPFGPSSIKLSEAGGIAVSPDGTRLYVAETGNDRIDEYTAKGRFIRAWGWGVRTGAAKLETCLGPTEEEELNGETEGKVCGPGLTGPEAGEMNQPFGVAVSPDGKTVYVVNAAPKDLRVQSFSVAGENVTFAGNLPAGFGKTGAGQANLHYPLPSTNDVAVGPNGRIYVADSFQDRETFELKARVFVFSPQRKLLDTIETGPSTITALALGPDGLLYLAKEGLVEVIDPAGVVPTTSFEPGASANIVAIAIFPQTGNLLLEQATVDGQALSTPLLEVTRTGEPIRTVTYNPVTPPPSNRPYPFGLAYDPSFQNEDQPGRSFKPGLIYFVNRYEGEVALLADQAPAKPSIQSVDHDAGVEGVSLSASVSPVGADTHVYFEYGSTPAYGFTSPALPGPDIGAGFGAKTVATNLYGLTPGATYHYRVVATSPLGTVTSSDRTFSTFPFAGASALPDGRAWEQVTTEKGPHNVTGIFAAPGGDGVAFESIAPLPGSASGAVNAGYVALRGSDRWTTESAAVPVEAGGGATLLISADLSKSVGETDKNLGGPPTPTKKFYLRDNATGIETLIADPLRGFVNYAAVGSSSDFDHIFFEGLGASLTADTPESAGRALYEYGRDGLRNVGILPGAASPTATPVTANLLTEPTHLVSEDGSRVFFTTEPAPENEGETNAEQIFVRIDGSRTVEVSASQAKVADPEADAQRATFVGAAADGSAAFFKSNARLTDDADTGSEGGEARDREPNLYRYDLGTGKLEDLTVSDDPADEALGSAVTGGVLVADGGRSAYFVARGDLAAGGVSGGYNLYRWTLSGGVTFLASLGEGDLLSKERTSGEAASWIARTTADGSVLMLTSTTALDPTFPESAGIREIFRYAAGDGFTCVSCARTVGSQVAAQITRPSYVGRSSGSVLSSNGSRFFFGTAAALVPQDTDGVEDVYEWENGQTYLISSGTGVAGAKLVDASVSGDDVFFETADGLVPGDQDGFVDIYDAKVGGGLPGLATTGSAPCEGAGCRSSSTSAPDTSVGSRSFNGPANPKHHRKKHRKKKRHRRHGRHHRQQKQKRSHGQPAVGKRG